jgi:hypothetical protein
MNPPNIPFEISYWKCAYKQGDGAFLAEIYIKENRGNKLVWTQI